LVRGIINGRTLRSGTSGVGPRFIKQRGGRFVSENALTAGLRHQSGGAVIEDYGTCMRWWNGDRQYSGRDRKHFHVVLP
jgi:hypothetical protein